MIAIGCVEKRADETTRRVGGGGSGEVHAECCENFGRIAFEAT